jgi:Tfp pilus assembly protein PilO
MMSLQNQTSWLIRAQWILGAATLALCAAFYLFAYRPQTSRAAQLQQQIVVQQKELFAGRAQTRELDAVRDEVNSLKVRLSRVKVLPKRQELAQFIQDIAKLADKTSLRRYNLRQPGMPVIGDQVNRQPIEMSFEGDFVNVFSFLRNTEDLPRLTRVPSLSIRSMDNRGQVRVTLTMNIYFTAD